MCTRSGPGGFRAHQGPKQDVKGARPHSDRYETTGGIQFLLGVSDIFDVEPPLAPGMQDNDYGPGFYGTYDPYGRYIFGSVQFTF
jgi:hypothetical protein